jgi:hypothetical protein
MTELLPHLPWLQVAGLVAMVALALGLRAWGGRWGLQAARVLLGLALIASIAWVVLGLRDVMRLMA